jgi:flagellar basal-body rod protein FlgB
MIVDAIFGKTIGTLEQSAQLRMARNSVLASNIANAETPHYRAVDIDFKATMAQVAEERSKPEHLFSLEKTDDRHIDFEDVSTRTPSRGIVFAAGDDTSIGNDNNSVNLEIQLARRQANTLFFNITVQLLNKKYAGLSKIIEGGSGA